ncbi:Puf2p [Saccharomyces cerevisiae x Saccharomyces kudriavzevii VIN7]|uniref:Puf2p n=1 Tax=Saccharomyces cerevisiae x Saccharomyces kudriavzevii (strain VIN7) TaxID=1095631 RepID=H0H2C5_SACCK|nr:Puf2p [Saccharomyces cerevisiae x Saccharomyces kudriavzevii VIN7]
MDNKRLYNGNLSNIPEVIDPGITIPIYEEDIRNDKPLNASARSAGVSDKRNRSSSASPQKIGSYRTRAGRFSDTITNLLPSISAKLHHSKKTAPAVVVPPATSTSDSLNSATYVPRVSSDSFTAVTPLSLQSTATRTRTRNNTASSQLTINSSSTNGATNTNIWSAGVDTNTSASPMFDYPHATSYFEPLTRFKSTDNYTLPQTAQLNSFLEKNGNSSIWSNTGNNTTDLLSTPTVNRQRSQSQSTINRVYTDAPYYQQPAQSCQVQMAPMIPKSAHLSPVILDDVDPASINWITANQNVPLINQISTLLPTNTISISNVFPLQPTQQHQQNTVNLTSTSLATLCSQYGNVLSARTLGGLNMALVEFSTVESAICALEALQGKELSKVGAPSTVSFARVLPMYEQPPNVSGYNNTAKQPLLQEQLNHGVLNYQQQQSEPQNQPQPTSFNQPNLAYTNPTQNLSHLQLSSTENEPYPFPLPPPTLSDNEDKLLKIITSFKLDHDQSELNHLLKNALKGKGVSDTSDFGPLPEHNSKLSKKKDFFDPPKLRELRKQFDSNSLSTIEIEQLAIVMLDQLPELSSDYLGNTVVQKLFENSSNIIRDIMLRKCNKYLTSMGVHKNGTWVCQKVIKMAKTPRQISLVTLGVRDYCTPLFNDQFGNYVIQGILKFGFPWNSFIFENVLSHFWTIVQNRYGSRAVRACLEADNTITQSQLLTISSLIIVLSPYLATDNNGTLLITWLLDTCALPNKVLILCDELVNNNLVKLCCHKLGSLTILKILNLRSGEEELLSKSKIIHALFDGPVSSESVLFQILDEGNYGPTFIYKVLTSRILDNNVRDDVITKIRQLILNSTINLQSRQLLEEIGLSSSGISPKQSSKNHRKQHSQGFHSPGRARGVSVSSVRSSNSRQNSIIQTNSTGPTPKLNFNPVPMSEINSYFNNQQLMFSTNQNQNQNSNFNGYDELKSQFDSFKIANGTNLSLPIINLPNGTLQPNVNSNGNNNNNSGYSMQMNPLSRSGSYNTNNATGSNNNNNNNNNNNTSANNNNMNSNNDTNLSRYRSYGY